jgi:hypothetical protein
MSIQRFNYGSAEEFSYGFVYGFDQRVVELYAELWLSQFNQRILKASMHRPLRDSFIDLHCASLYQNLIMVFEEHY